MHMEYNILKFAKKLIKSNGLTDNSVALYPKDGIVKEFYFNKSILKQREMSSAVPGDMALSFRPRHPARAHAGGNAGRRFRTPL